MLKPAARGPLAALYWLLSLVTGWPLYRMLFLQPSRWRRLWAETAPELNPGFSLPQLSLRQLGAAAPVLLSGFLLSTLFASSVLGALGGHPAHGAPAQLVTAIAGYGLNGVAVGGLFALFVGVGGGIAGGLASVFASWLLGNELVYRFGIISPPQVPGTNAGVPGLYGALFGFAVAFAVHVTLAGDKEEAAPGRLRQAGGVILGLLLAALALLIFLVLRDRLVGSMLGVLGLSLSLAWQQRHRGRGWRHGLLVGVAGSLAYVALAGAETFFSQLNFVSWTEAMRLAWDFAQPLLPLMLLLVPGMLAEVLGGPLSGAVAGALGGGGGWLLCGRATGAIPEGPWAAGGLVVLLAGLLLPLWRPGALYPLWLALAQVLYRHDQRSGALWVRWHPAFLDESLRLPLVGLDEHLLLTSQREPELFTELFEVVIRGPQRWAGARVQVALDREHLAGCEDVAMVAQAQRRLFTDAAGEAGAVLSSFLRVSQDVGTAMRLASVGHQRRLLLRAEEAMGALLGDLRRRASALAVSFLPAAERWRGILRERLALLEAQTQVQYKIDSPYVPGTPLSGDVGVFVGRAGVCRRIEEHLQRPHRPPLLLYGQRRIGKTSLLLHLGERLPSDWRVFFVDLQGPVSRAQTLAGFLFQMAGNLYEEARRSYRSGTLREISLTALERDPFVVFERWLSDLLRAFAGQRILLMLDEFEELEDALLAGRLPREPILGWLRHLWQHSPVVSLLLAGSHSLEETRLWSSHLVNVQTIHLPFLDKAEAQQLIERPVPGFPLRYEPAALRAVMRLAGGHSYLLQLLCDLIIAEKNAGRQGTDGPRHLIVEARDVRAAARRAMTQAAFVLDDMAYAQLDPTARSLMINLANRGAGARFTRAEVLAGHGRLAEAALRQVLQRELVVHRSGAYRVRVELVRRFFASQTQV